MLSKMRNTNQKGFTLIELMIVIAIIGILAAIAIPNFIAYRNKSYCSAAVNDAKSVAATIADYFSNPNRTSIETPDIEDLVTMSFGNTFTIAQDADTDVIEIVVTDETLRCPEGDDYVHYVGGDTQAYWVQ